MHVSLCVCCVVHGTDVQVKNGLQELFLSSHHVGLGDGTQIFKLIADTFTLSLSPALLPQPLFPHLRIKTHQDYMLVFEEMHIWFCKCDKTQLELTGSRTELTSIILLNRHSIRLSSKIYLCTHRLEQLSK